MSKILYPWLNATWEQLRASLEQNSLPGALLFSATKGLGDDELVEFLCDTLLCSSCATEPCGFCHSCSLMTADTHPDLHRVSPAEGKSSISVDQIRECNKYALESSQLNGLRVIVISPAEAMTESAMNALLKTLESPPSSCVFILQSRVPHRLLPTIKSRCQHWHVATPQPAEYQEWLEQQQLSTLPPLYIQLCLGAPLQLKTFIDEKRDKAFESMLQSLLDFIRIDFALPKTFIDSVSANTLEQLQLLSIALIELQKSYFTEQVTVTKHSVLSQLRSQLTYQQVFDLTKELLVLIERLTLHTGLNKELLISQWLIQTKI